MPRTDRLRCAVAFVAMLAFNIAAPATAQDAWPTKPVKVVVPFPAGGAADMIARLVMSGLSEKLGQQFYVENRVGAGGAIGSQAVARAEPDGYTLVVSGVGSHVTAPLTNAKVGYDPLTDFTHVVMLGGTANTFAVHPSVKANTFAEFVKLAAETPGGITYASSGAGTLSQMGFEYFRMKAGINIRVVPYTGGGTALNDALGGHVPAIYSLIGDLGKAGKLRALAVSTEQRVVATPDTPTFKELGYDLVIIPWFAVSGPKNLPANIVAKLNTEVRELLKRPDIKARIDAASIVTMDFDVARTQRYFAEELARWSDAAKFVSENSK